MFWRSCLFPVGGGKPIFSKIPFQYSGWYFLAVLWPWQARGRKGLLPECLGPVTQEGGAWPCISYPQLLRVLHVLIATVQKLLQNLFLHCLILVDWSTQELYWKSLGFKVLFTGSSVGNSSQAATCVKEMGLKFGLWLELCRRGLRTPWLSAFAMDWQLLQSLSVIVTFFPFGQVWMFSLWKL